MIEEGVANGDGVVTFPNGDAIFSYEYDTVRLPANLGGAWVCVLEREVVHLPDGRIGILNHLGHPRVNVIEMRDGSGFVWVSKSGACEEE
tara:strand:- start:193 stop:462 length:270 start_codon:yes stop_codon:yes gene_type:complete